MTAARPTSRELIEEGQALVHSLATRIFRNIPFRADLDDLIAYGEVGLAEAANKFDPEQGTQFTSFAYYRIQGAIYDGLSKMSWTNRAAYRRARFHQMAGEVLEQDAGSKESFKDESLESGAQWFRNISEKLAVVYFASQVENVDEVFEDPAESAPSRIARNEVNDRLVKLVDELPNQARILIRTIYFDGHTLNEAALRMGISKSWASRIHAKILEQLARSLRKMGASD